MKESELKCIIAQQAARHLENICDSDEFQTAGDSFWQAILAAIRFGRRQLLAEIFADEEAMEENMRGRLMNRKGKSAKDRKRAEFGTDIFRQKVQNLVAEGVQTGKTAREMWPFVRRWLRGNARQQDSDYIYSEGTYEAKAQQATVRKWVRQEHKKLIR